MIFFIDSIFYDVFSWMLFLVFGMDYVELGDGQFSNCLFGQFVEVVLEVVFVVLE